MSHTNGSNTVLYIYVGVSIIAIGVLIGFLIRCEGKTCSPYTPGMSGQELRSYYDYDDKTAKRDICLCNPVGRKLCANRQQLLMKYQEGKTEYQDLAVQQKAAGGPRWKNTNFMPAF